MRDGGPKLGLDVVADDRYVFFPESSSPLRITRDKNRDVVDQGDAGFEESKKVYRSS